MKCIFITALLSVCTLYGARSRGPVAVEWNTNDVCLEQDFGAITSIGAWYVSSWLHAYYQTPEWWIYHCDKGWLYPESDGNSGVWFYWQQTSSWVWTHKDVYPMAYDAGNDQWFDFCIKPGKEVVYIN